MTDTLIPYDPAVHRLGRKPFDPHGPHLFLSDYATEMLATAPPVPAVRMWVERPVNWGYHLNDQLGDCVEAMFANAVMLWTDDSTPGGSGLVTPTDADVLHFYEVAGNYNPSDPTTDQGTTIDAGLSYMHTTGLAGVNIQANALIAPNQTGLVRRAINEFGGCASGVNLPLSARSQIGGVWTTPPGGTTGDGAPGSWGGHAVWIVGYSPQYVFAVTWNIIQKIDWTFWLNYFDEAVACLSRAWVQRNGRAPSGFNTNQMIADMKKL
jgi:hypothetical protein